jgi:hypothetical protein
MIVELVDVSSAIQSFRLRKGGYMETQLDKNASIGI